VGVCLSDMRDLAAAEAFFRSAWAVTGGTPDRITIGGYDAYPRAIGTGLGDQVTPRTDCYLNGHVEQDHRGTEQRHPSTGGLNSFVTAPRFCLVFDEIRTHLRPSLHRQQPVKPAHRRHLHRDRFARLMGIMVGAPPRPGAIYVISLSLVARKLTQPSLGRGLLSTATAED
jgi:putative transposase